jgi:hypothetical protein
MDYTVVIPINNNLGQMLAGVISPAERDLRVNDVKTIVEKDCDCTPDVITRKIIARDRSILLHTHPGNRHFAGISLNLHSHPSWRSITNKGRHVGGGNDLAEEVLLILRTTSPAGLGASLVPASEPLRRTPRVRVEPAISRAAVALASPTPTPPLARMRNWFGPVSAKAPT